MAPNMSKIFSNVKIPKIRFFEMETFFTLNPNQSGI